MGEFISADIKAVIFDHDDTLVGTIEPKWAAHKHIAHTHYRKILTDDDIRKHWGMPLRQMVGLLYGDEDLDRAAAFEQSTHALFPKVLFEHTLEVVRTLGKSGLYLGLVTAASRASMEHDFETLGIPIDAFDYLQTQEDTDYHKPDWRVFKPAFKWLASIAVEPAETLYIGDGLHDRSAALEAGFNFLGVTTGLVTAEQFAEAGSASIPSLEHLL